MLEMMEYLDERFTLDLYIPASLIRPKYLLALQRRAKLNQRIRFHEEIDYDQLLETTSHFDLGLALFPPKTTSLKGALPNKFFEYVQARLGVVVGPNSEMSDYVRQYGFGVVTEGFAARDLATTLNALTADDVRAFKRCADEASAELCFEAEQIQYEKVMEEIQAQRKWTDRGSCS